MDVQLSSSHQESMEEFTQPVWETIGFPVNQHVDPAVEIPTEDDDVMAGVNGRGTERPEVVVAVNQK
jgi:hypothetical protein